MRIKLVGNKADSEIHVVRVIDAASTKRGQPVCFQFAGVPGLDVIGPAQYPSNPSAATAVFAGILVTDINLNDYGQALVYGYTPNAMLTASTRSASTVPFPSMASLGVPAQLILDTLNNGFITAPYGTNTLPMPICMLANSVAAITSFPSTGTNLVAYVGVPAFIRAL